MTRLDFYVRWHTFLALLPDNCHLG